MKRFVALLGAVGFAASSVVGCTPKPVSARPIAEEFLESMETRNNEELVQLIDDGSTATNTLDATFAGLQAEGLDVELTGVDQE